MNNLGVNSALSGFGVTRPFGLGTTSNLFVNRGLGLGFAGQNTNLGVNPTVNTLFSTRSISALPFNTGQNVNLRSPFSATPLAASPRINPAGSNGFGFQPSSIFSATPLAAAPRRNPLGSFGTIFGGGGLGLGGGSLLF